MIEEVLKELRKGIKESEEYEKYLDKKIVYYDNLLEGFRK